jgi:hypothetical protein
MDHHHTDKGPEIPCWKMVEEFRQIITVYLGAVLSEVDTGRIDDSLSSGI